MQQSGRPGKKRLGAAAESFKRDGLKFLTSTTSSTSTFFVREHQKVLLVRGNEADAGEVPFCVCTTFFCESITAAVGVVVFAVRTITSVKRTRVLLPPPQETAYFNPHISRNNVSF